MSLADEPPLRDQSLLHPDNLRAFLGKAVPHLAAGFDCTRARLLDREFPVDDWRRREADLPFEIPYRTATEEIWALVCVLIEHQSDTDPLMPLRLLYFAVVYWEQQWKAWERLPTPRTPLRLRPVVPIVLYTGARPWGSNRTLLDLLDEPAAFHAFAPAWQPLFWNLADQTPEQLLQTGEEWLQVLAVVRAESAEAAEFAAVFAEALKRLQGLHGRDRVRWYDLLRIVLTWAMWRRPQPEQEALLTTAKASEDNAQRQREIEEMSERLGATIADLAMAKGKMLGIQQGQVQGQLQARREDLRIFLEDRFGPLSQDVIQRIESLDDLEALKQAIHQVSRLRALEDLRL